MGKYAGGFVVRRDDDGEIQDSIEFFLCHRIMSPVSCTKVELR
jgi:hypothetical protein